MFFKNVLCFLLLSGSQNLFAPEEMSLFIITDEVAKQKLSDKLEGFSADTLVRVPDGYKKISELLLCDSVLSFDFENCKNSISVVTGFFCTVSDTSTKLHLTNEDTNISELLVLDEKQRFLRENLLDVDDPWIMVKDCEKQNLLSLSQSLLKSQVMASNSKHLKPEKLYSIEVRPHHNYFVTKHDLLTHNIIIEGLTAAAVCSGILAPSAGGFGLGHLAAIASWIFGAYNFNENTIKIADEKRQLDYRLQAEQLLKNRREEEERRLKSEQQKCVAHRELPKHEQVNFFQLESKIDPQGNAWQRFKTSSNSCGNSCSNNFTEYSDWGIFSPEGILIAEVDSSGNRKEIKMLDYQSENLFDRSVEEEPVVIGEEAEKEESEDSSGGGSGGGPPPEPEDPDPEDPVWKKVVKQFILVGKKILVFIKNHPKIMSSVGTAIGGAVWISNYLNTVQAFEWLWQKVSNLFFTKDQKTISDVVELKNQIEALIKENKAFCKKIIKLENSKKIAAEKEEKRDQIIIEIKDELKRSKEEQIKNNQTLNGLAETIQSFISSFQKEIH